MVPTGPLDAGFGTAARPTQDAGCARPLHCAHLQITSNEAQGNR
jgi:hypothetical protein